MITNVPKGVHDINNDMFKKFPVEKKDQIINYIKIAYPKDYWNALIWNYTLGLNIQDWEEGQDFYMDTIRSRQRLLLHFVLRVLYDFDKKNFSVEWTIEQIKKRNITLRELHECMFNGYNKLDDNFVQTILLILTRLFNPDGTLIE